MITSKNWLKLIVNILFLKKLFQFHLHRFLSQSLCLSLSRFPKQPPEVCYKKCVTKNFAKFLGKHLCRCLFFNRDAGLRIATLLQKRLQHRRFHVNFDTSGRLLLFIHNLLPSFIFCNLFTSFLISLFFSSYRVFVIEELT